MKNEMKRRIARSTAAAIVAAAVALAPGVAQADDASSDSTSYTTFGYVPTDTQGQAQEAAVEEQVREVESFNPGETLIPQATPTESRSLQAALDGSYTVVSSWTDNQGKPTVARRGNGTTWGLTKVQTKHNATLSMIQKTTKFPRPGGRTTEGSSIVYKTDAIEWECWLGVCNPKRSMSVKVVIENARLSDGLQKGLITAYCEGVTACPQWVINVTG
ncbi:hypothetical protein [Microbacterium hydrocarbonoxydans]|uniref:hypothetical protein n=1 Tax=Microbacterium hydrocarbonoxydans TaxID=273678 RepID=UPI003D97F959